MCGIHGVISAKSFYNKPLCEFIRQAFITNTLRGVDSSGMFQIGTTKGSVYLHKDAVAGWDFVQQKESEALIRDTDTSLFTVCHVRAKTQGEVKKDNAHPFTGWTDEGDRVIGVHNGSLVNWKTKPGGNEHDVDSSWAIQQIAERGHAAIQELQGAFSIVYWDEEQPKKINFVRNSQRPMHFLFSKDRKHMMFASEAGMLLWLADRVKFDHDGKIREMPVDTVFTFDTSGDVLTWESTKLKMATTTYSSGTYYGNGGYGSYGRTGSGYSSSPAGTANYTASTFRPPAVVNMLDRWKEYLSTGAATTPASTVSSNVRPLCEVAGACDDGFPDEDLPSFDGTTSALRHHMYDPEFVFPENLIPPFVHLRVDEEEMKRAKDAGIFGAIVHAEWDTWYSKTKTMFGTFDDSETGIGYDIAFREVSKREADRLHGKETDMVIVGVDDDGTFLVRKITKRMRQFATQ